MPTRAGLLDLRRSMGLRCTWAGNVPPPFARAASGATANPSHRGSVRARMDASLLTAKFARIGARLRVADRPARRFRSAGPVALDVGADRRGEYFEVVRRAGADPAA